MILPATAVPQEWAGVKFPCQGAYYLGLHWKLTYAIAEAMPGCFIAKSVMASAYYVEVGKNKSL